MYTIGVDFGTESGRAVLVDCRDGCEVATAMHPYAHGVIDGSLPGSEVPLPPDRALQGDLKLPDVVMAGEQGFEPRLPDPESGVLPLDDSPR